MTLEYSFRAGLIPLAANAWPVLRTALLIIIINESKGKQPTILTELSEYLRQRPLALIN
jgi:hypothetical protein